jgi:pseudo-rSAM protein
MKSKKEKSYWFYIHPHTYLSQNKKKVVFFNTLNNKLLEYSDKEISKFSKKLKYDWNLGVVGIREKEISSKLESFFSDIRNHFMGDLIDTSYRKNKPIQIIPSPKLRYISPELMTDQSKELLVLDEIFDCLKSITLYLTNSCGMNCSFCSQAYRQFTCCHKSSTNNEIPIQDMERMFKELERFDIGRFNFIGGDIFDYSHLNELINKANQTNAKRCYYTHLNNLRETNYLELLAESKLNELVIIVSSPFDKSLFSKKIDLMKKYNIAKKFIFVTETEGDLSNTEQIFSDFSLNSVQIRPYYNKKNLDFFENFVYIDKEDIRHHRLTHHDIFSRGFFNTSNIRKLTILSDKKIYANANHKAIGILGKDQIADIVVKELESGKSWRRIRKNVSPCKGCVYNCLCPPISNYEYSIGRYNLCSIFNEG